MIMFYDKIIDSILLFNKYLFIMDKFFKQTSCYWVAFFIIKILCINKIYVLKFILRNIKSVNSIMVKHLFL